MNLKPTTKKKIPLIPFWLINMCSFCVIIMVSFFLIDTSVKMQSIEENKTQAAVIKTFIPLEKLSVNPYKEVALKAQAAIVFDSSSGNTVYGFNENTQLPLASITKLMTAAVASEVLPEFTLIPIVNREVEYDPQLKVGESWPLSDIIKYTLLTSSNTGADSIALAVASFLGGKGTLSAEETAQDSFISLMNVKATEIGLGQTYFLNGSGLDTQAKISGAYGSTHDVALLMTYLYKNHYNLLEPTKQERMNFTAPDGRVIEAKNTNSLVSSIPGIVGSKTGLTDLAGGNLAIMFDASFGQPFVIVVLGSTQEERFSDVEQLLKATRTYLSSALLSEETSSEDITP